MIADMNAGRALVAVVAVLVAAVPTVSAHDLERTRVSLTFLPDGSFVLDIANDPDWLLLRLEPFAADERRGTRIDTDRAATTPVGGRLAPAARDRRLAELAPVFVDRIVLFVDGHEVRPTSVEYVAAASTGFSGSAASVSSVSSAPALSVFRLRGRVSPSAANLRWFYGIVGDPYPLIITRADGRAFTEWIAGTAWSAPIDLTGQFGLATTWQVFAQYLGLGYTHILPKGMDHILFVLGLFLVSVRLRPILVQVTAFTLAHSLTLGLAMYGVVALPTRIVEPLIALSIAYVAVENLATRELTPSRLALVFMFGLLHGLGFAGVLRDLGLPRGEFLTGLLAFNLGVEGGQLTVIGGALAAVVWFRHRPAYRQWIVVPASLAIAAIGLYWTVVRVVARG
jgi:hypothetical protein